MHAISWLKTDPPNTTGAEFALNRSLYAACYGDFNVRNEVDVHQTTVGAHYNNTHFLTGDGGYIQILVYGFGGLMLAKQSGIQMNQPILPKGTTSLAIKSFQYLGSEVDFEFDGVHMIWNASGPGLCLFKPPRGMGDSLPLSSELTIFKVIDFFGGNFTANARYGRLGYC